MWRIALVVVAIFSILGFQPIAHADEKTISVMTRNIYLGADVGVALELLPDFPAAAQFMWDQMRTTRFEERSKYLAKEFARYKPDLIGIQEATKWVCKKGLLSRKRTIFDFLEILIRETKKSDVGYSLITKNGKSALNTGFSIPAIPRLTIVEDAETFGPIFGTTRAACGFEIADAFLIRDDFDAKVLQIGTTEFKDHYTVIPVAMEIYRGYTWADIEIDGQPVRFVTTHLESLFDENSIPHSSIQAEQLIEDLSSTTIPLVVIGDFNADPRDPRPTENPGGQPIANNECNAQKVTLSKTNFISECNAYWKMIDAGYLDAGPSALDPKNFTWGATALLNGPDVTRSDAAKNLGNDFGFTDRLDYIFVKNGIQIESSKLVSQTWPQGDFNWKCLVEEKEQICLPADHVGIASTLTIDRGSSSGTPERLPDHQTFPWMKWIAILFIVTLISVILWIPYRFIVRPFIIKPLSRRSRNDMKRV